MIAVSSSHIISFSIYHHGLQTRIWNYLTAHFCFCFSSQLGMLRVNLTTSWYLARYLISASKPSPTLASLQWSFLPSAASSKPLNFHYRRPQYQLTSCYLWKSFSSCSAIPPLALCVWHRYPVWWTYSSCRGSPRSVIEPHFGHRWLIDLEPSTCMSITTIPSFLKNIYY